MPTNKKIQPDLEHIAKLRDMIHATADGGSIAKAVVEVAYQLAMLRGDLADVFDEELKA